MEIPVLEENCQHWWTVVHLILITKSNTVYFSEGENIIITGYGGSSRNTLGYVDLPFSIYGVDFQHRFYVMNDDDLQYSMVLGLDFLKDKGVILDTHHRTVTFKPGSEKSEIRINIDDRSNLLSVKVQDVPVIATNDVKIGKGQCMFISVKSTCNAEISGPCYFEGSTNRPVMEYYDGILNAKEEATILVKNNHEKKGMSIKKGEVVGTISTLLSIDEPQEDIQDDWDLGKLQDKIVIDHSELDDEKKKKVYEMLLDVNLALSKDDSDMGKADVPPHHIEMKDTTPIWQKPRVFAQPVNEEIEAQCEELLSNDIIEHSDSCWSSPCVPVRKPDGTLRLCIDYRKVNVKTVTEQFPMPNLQNCLYNAHDVKYFTKLDLVRGYYQVEIDKDSRQYTAFSTIKNHYQFKRLAFGLKNSGIAFQRTMQKILSPVCSSNVIIYIDDILIMSKTFEEHLKLVSKVLHTLAKYHIKIKVKKCEFFKDKVNFLGHLLSRNGIEKSPEYVAKVKDFPRPNTITELRQFLGLVNFQRKFVPRCAEICKPLYEITGQPKKAKITWTPERLEAFERIKEEIAKEITISYPDYNPSAPKMELFVDASAVGAGACLMQMQDGEVKIMGYASMTFSPTQASYSTIERELSAIRWGLGAFKPFLLGISFVLYTDHRPLIYMQNMAPHNSRIERTLLDLSEYDFEIKYRKGSDNEAADYLSRVAHKQNEKLQPEGLPKDMKVLQKIDGGGDAMFAALLEGMKFTLDDEDSLPGNHLQLRAQVIGELLKDPKKYGLLSNQHERKRLKIMLNPGQLPCTEAFLAVCNLFKIEIRVFHDMPIPVVYKVNETSTNPVVNLQCISFVHYNPLISSKCNSKYSEDERNINLCMREVHIISGDEEDEISNDESIDQLFDDNETVNQRSCGHSIKSSWIVASYNDVTLCAFLDTGAQVSVIDEEVWEKIRRGDEELRNPVPKELHGMGGASTSVIGTVCLQLKDANDKLFCKMPFAVVKNSGIPCCLLLGLNFLSMNRSSLDFSRKILAFEDRSASICSDNGYQNESYSAWCGVVEAHNNITFLSDEDDNRTVKFVISDAKLQAMQNSNHAVRLLRHRVSNHIPVNRWNHKSLCQFRRHHDSLLVESNVLVRKIDDISVVVISFPFLVELLSKVHRQVAHCGRHKLLAIIGKVFWHPAADKVARDICASCHYCQLYKTNIQQENPPTLKINSQFPFKLVAADVVLFSRSSSGNIAALVMVDLCSKWLCAVPIKNKTSSVVSATLSAMLSTLPRVPLQILTDNGGEFVASHTRDILREFGITQLFSSPYHPSSNGAVERANRTLKDLIMAITESTTEWDVVLPRAVQTYNSTYHSQIKCSPSEFIMNNPHQPDYKLNVNRETIDSWKEGHPNFAPFSVGQKVIKKIHKGGHSTAHKFSPRFDGPYIVRKMQSNRISYEIFHEDAPNQVFKAHHTQLRPWREVPYYIQKYLKEEEHQE